MLADFWLPVPDGGVFLGVVLFAGALGFLALGVWRRDRWVLRRCVSDGDAVPQPVPEADTAPFHRLPESASSSPEPTAPSQAPRAARTNLHGQGHEDNGAIARRLWRAVAEVARVLPPHSFRVEVLLDCRGLCVEEPAFSLALAALLLHAAQFGRSHLVELAPLAPEHPLYRRSTSPQLILHITTESEQAGPPSYLADRALDVCRLAGGTGSIEADSDLWLIWQTTRQPLCAERPASAVPSTSQAPAVCA